MDRDAKSRTDEVTVGGGPGRGRDFIRTIIEEDLAAGRHDRVVTRFPPEPNGFLHIGHAKAICVDFGVVEEYGGQCHLRFDDTNPETEDPRYVASIKNDVRWLGFDWGEHEYYASDYFEQLYDWAVLLLREGKAYVDDSTEEEIRKQRGTVTEPGTDSAYRGRSVEENVDLFERMRAGEFPDGSRVLRAKIDMAHPNMKMRDPLMYRIRHAHHYRRGDDWCIYPFYDWAHGQSDAIEGITHSLCTLEFENNRELYDWYVEQIGVEHRPRQYEFARLNVEYTLTSKRKLCQLVESGRVSGWDDPRMPTLSGLRRRGVPPEAIRSFCDAVGVAKSESRVDIGMLEHAIRDHLNHEAPRVMCILTPLRVVITSWDADEVDDLDASYWPHDVPREGSRKVPFGRELWIERDDFMEEPPKKFFRLAPGREVRLRYGYVIRCNEVVKDADGEIVELRCTHDPETRGGTTPDGRKVKGTIHWVSARHSVPAQVRLYDRLFSTPEPGADTGDFLDDLNPDSLDVIEGAQAEPRLARARAGEHFQFERIGYFFVDPVDSADGSPVFNRVVTLRDTWAKIAAAADATAPGDVVKRAGEASADAVGVAEPVSGSHSEARDRVRRAHPELAERFERYQRELGLTAEDADMLTGERSAAEIFEAALEAHENPASVANWLIHGVLPELRARDADAAWIGPGVGRLASLVDDGTISATIAKEVLAEMLESGGDPRDIVERRGLRQIDDAEELGAVIEELLAANPDKVAAYRDGRTALMGFFMGQVMRQTSGRAKPDLVKGLLEKSLS